MSLLRTRIREKSRFTVFDIDPQTAAAWGQALLRWAQAQAARRPGWPSRRAADRAMVDVALALHGRGLPRDHAWRWPMRWRVRCPGWPRPLARMHRSRSCRGRAGGLLSRRARLLLRVPRERAGARCADGPTLRVGDSAMRMGESQPRELLPHATLYAHFVAADDAGRGRVHAGSRMN